MSTFNRVIRRMQRLPAIAITLLMVTAVVPGCRSQADIWRAKRPKTHRVTGLVTLDGTPVDGAMVTFHATEASSVAAGITDARGRFTLRTYDPGDGAIAGTYKVLIEKKTERMPDGYNPDSPAPPPPPIIEHRLPTQYAELKTSPLTATIKAGGSNTFSFALSSSPMQSKED